MGKERLASWPGATPWTIFTWTLAAVSHADGCQCLSGLLYQNITKEVAYKHQKFLCSQV